MSILSKFDLRNGDCLEVLKTIPDDSVDSIVTDPPYGLSFMNKKWDYDVPSTDVWKECLRVLKPGGHLLAFAGTRTQHRMAARIEDAGFEIRDMIAWAYGCLDDKTECLTSSGWKNYKDLSTTDSVMQWDSETGALSWTNPIEVMTYPYSGDMVRVVNRHTDQMLTPNHRVYARIRRHSRHAKATEYEVVDAAVIHGRSCSWSVDLPMAGVHQGNIQVAPDFAYLVGWFMTDSWVHGDGKAVMFSQSKPKTLTKLRECLSKYSPSEHTKDPRKDTHSTEHTFYVTGEIADKLISEFGSRELTWDMLNWSFDSRMRLFDGLMDGDGSHKEGQHSHCFWTQRQHRRDVFLALCLSLGFRAYEDAENGCVYVNVATSTTQVQGKHVPFLEKYDGEVWCVRVPTGAFVVRRSGRPFITGNSGFPKSMDVSKAIDKRLGTERKIISERKRGTAFDPNGEGGGGFKRGSVIVSEPATELAKEWEGWGTSLKPAIEPITVARKPLGGLAVVDSVCTYGTGAINIDGCRVPTTDKLGGGGESADTSCKFSDEGWVRPWMKDESAREEFAEKVRANVAKAEALGRFPANLIHDGSDEVVGLFPGSNGAGGSLPQVKITGYGDKIGNGESSYIGGDRTPFDSGSGSAARFFNSCQFDDEDLESIPLIYCAKASKADRETGLADSPIGKAGSLNMRTDNHSEENGQTTAPRANIHPTVKPTALMRHLIRLVTPPGGTTLDPFTGSGTTGKAAMLEGMNFVGIELSPEYFEIASKRILHARDNKSCYDEAGRVVNEKQSTPSSVSIEEVFG